MKKIFTLMIGVLIGTTFLLNLSGCSKSKTTADNKDQIEESLKEDPSNSTEEEGMGENEESSNPDEGVQ